MVSRIRHILSAFLASCVAAVSCMEIYVPQEQIEEKHVVRDPSITLSCALVGGYSSEFSCNFLSPDRVFVQGGIYYGLAKDLKDAQRIPGILVDNVLTVMATDLISDTTYYYQAYATDRHGTVTTEVYNFHSASFNIKDADYILPYEGGEIVLNVTTNEDFLVDLSGIGWISEAPKTKANKEFEKVLNVEMNHDFSSRGTDILLSSPDGYFKKTVTISQEGAPLRVKDPVVMKYLVEKYDKDGSGEVDGVEIMLIDTVSVRSSSISTLEGLEKIPNLRYLSLGGTEKEGPAGIQSADVSVLPKLKYLDLSYNLLREVDVAQNPDLLHLDFSHNSLSAISLKNQILLEDLIVSNNYLTELDLAFNPSLEVLEADDNQLEVLKNLSSLGLRHLSFCNNGITALDIRRNTALEYFACDGNGISKISFVNNKKLQTIHVADNKLSTLYLKDNHELRDLDCSGNGIDALDLSYNVKLEKLNCSGNLISNLYLAENRMLNSLDVRGNDIILLDVSRCPHMESLYCNDNLHTLFIDYSQVIDGVYPSRNSNHINRMTSIKSRTDEVKVSNREFLKYLCEHYDANGDGKISIDEGMSVTSINVCTDKISSLSGIEAFANLKYLKCSGTIAEDGSSNGQLTSLDVSSNLWLEQLICDGNWITSLNLKNNGRLRTLWCYSNNLTTLDVSNNPELTDLNCSGNHIGYLDFTANPSLSALDCSPMNDGKGNNCLFEVKLSKQKIKYVNDAEYRRSASNIPTVTRLLTDTFASPFMFNYHSKRYDSTTKSILNQDEADWRIALEFNRSVSYYEDGSLFVNTNNYSTYRFASAEDNPFNRDAKNSTLTIIVKTQNFSSNNYSLFSNRGLDYNYMFRQGEQSSRYYYLHDSRGYGSAPGFRSYASPDIVSVRVSKDGNVTFESHLSGVTKTGEKIVWGNPSDAIAFFNGSGYDDLGEHWYGRFYWIYLSLEELSDQEIETIIKYNEELK